MRAVPVLGALAALLVVASGNAPARDTAARSVQIAVATADGRILLIDTKGRRLATLTRPTRRGQRDWAPACSPDGKRIAFARTTDGDRTFHIYVVRADGRGVRRITRGRFDESPAWSPDGRWIAYASMDGLRLVHPDGNGGRLVPGTGTSGAHYSMPFASDPSWTPGGRLAYSFHPENASDWPPACERPSSRCGWVWTSRPDGRLQRPVVRGRDAHWSNGRLVVYTRPNGGVAAIPARGGTSRFLGRGYKADWSPDGRTIVFARMGGMPGGDGIWVMNANGSNRHRIFRGATDPAWRPSSTR
jgi:dipeptidyl aminopeptidase/acylaminoacyl peptidase